MRAIARPGILVLLTLAAALLLPQAKPVDAASFSEVTKLTASDAQANDRFGTSVAVSGDTAVVGAVGNDAGVAYVFQRDQGGTGNWGEVKKLLASDTVKGDFFGYSVAISADTAIVGAVGESAGGFQAGAAYVFQRDQGGADNWGEVTKLTASDAQAFDFFSGSVAVSGDTAIVGAQKEDAGGDNAGAAYVFQRDQGGADNWGEVKKLLAADAQADDNFGNSVAVSGDTTVVGAWLEDAGGAFAGAAYVFQRNQGGADNWGEVKKLLASDAQASDGFGVSVAVSGDSAVVGAVGEDAGGSAAGAAYVFQRDQGGADNWGEVKKLTASDAQASDVFGNSVAVSGDTVVVGAVWEGAGGFRAGAAYVFQRNQGGADNWGEVTKLTASDAQANDRFGTSVAVSGDTAVVGADDEDASGSNAGAAYVFEAAAPPPPTRLRYIASGDSIPAGTDLRRWETEYPVKFKNLLGPNAGLTVDFSSTAVSGHTTDEYITQQLPQIIAADPDVVSVTVGADDVLKNLRLFLGCSVPISETNLRFILTQLLIRTDAVVILTNYYQPITAGRPGIRVLWAFNFLACVAEGNTSIGIIVSDLSRIWPDRLVLIDVEGNFIGHELGTRDSYINRCSENRLCQRTVGGVHPNDKGHQSIASEMWRDSCSMIKASVGGSWPC